jgi:hypothetical protein
MRRGAPHVAGEGEREYFSEREAATLLKLVTLLVLGVAESPTTGCFP